jgi:apolipoprotein N-acyltransferase
MTPFESEMLEYFSVTLVAALSIVLFARLTHTRRPDWRFLISFFCYLLVTHGIQIKWAISDWTVILFNLLLLVAILLWAFANKKSRRRQQNPPSAEQ